MISRIINSTSCALVSILLIACQGNATEVKSFRYSGEKELSLEGDWMFYWEQLLYSGDLALETDGFKVEFPNFWNDHQHKDYSPTSFGYASYRTIIITEKDTDIALEYTGPHCAQRIYLNGELIAETGKVGKSRKNYKPLWLPGTVKTHLKKGQNELIIQISNFDHTNGGIYRAPKIGQPEYLLSKRNRNLLLDSFIAGGLFIMGIFFLGLSIFWRNSRLFIYFGLFAVLFSIWYINFGTHAFKVYFPKMSWNVAMHLTYFSFYGFSLFMRYSKYHLVNYI